MKVKMNKKLFKQIILAMLLAVFSVVITSCSLFGGCDKVCQDRKLCKAKKQELAGQPGAYEAWLRENGLERTCQGI